MSSGANSSGARRRTRVPIGTWCARRRSCWRRRGCRTRRSPSGWGSRARPSRSGENASARKACRGLRRDLGRVGRGVFPPAQVAEVKALACELPAEQGVALSRWSSAELAREAVKRGIVATIAAVTVWRWLSEDAIRPWNYRSWIFPRDPDFAQKAGRILDLYQGRWEGQLLEPGDYVVCADEKPSIQARGAQAPQPARRPRRRRAVRRARVRAQGSALLPRRLGRPPRQAVRSLRTQRRDRRRSISWWSSS